MGWFWRFKRKGRAAERHAAEVAATWFIRMREQDLSAAEKVEFMQWLKASRMHVREYLRIDALHFLLARLGPQLWTELPAAQATAAASELRPLPSASSATPNRGSSVDPDLPVISLVRRTPDGIWIEADRFNLDELVHDLCIDPSLLHKLHWRKVEEIVAAGYARRGFDKVELTPRSNDRGRDVIATIGTIRVFDQVKAYAPHRRVTRSDVLAVVGVLETQANFSKAYVSTTSDFAPGIRKDPDIARLMPFRLQLRNGNELVEWLAKSGDMRVA